MREWETAVMLIRDAQGHVLMVHQAYGDERYGLPGGKVEPGETPAAAAQREVYEETGLDVIAGAQMTVEDLIDPNSGAEYRAHVFHPGSIEGTPAVQDPTEIQSVGWYDRAALPKPLTPSAAAVMARLDQSEP